MKKITIFIILVITSVSFAANKGLLFDVTANNPNLTIRPNVDFYYPSAGIKITSPGFTLQNQGQDCTLSASGYCLFAASPTQPKTLTVAGDGQLTFQLCTNGDGPLNCQNYEKDFRRALECTGDNPTCFVMVSKNLVDGAMNVTTPSGAPSVSSCNQTGIDKADCICSIEGPAANEGRGTWRAWLGLRNVGNPRERLNLLSGTSAFPDAAIWVSLETSQVIYPNWGVLGPDISNYPDALNPISPTAPTVNTGGFNRPGDTPSSFFADTCNEWTSNDSANSVDPGNPQGLNAANNELDSWNDSILLDCATSRPIYCTEVQP